MLLRIILLWEASNLLLKEIFTIIYLLLFLFNLGTETAPSYTSREQELELIRMKLKQQNKVLCFFVALTFH